MAKANGMLFYEASALTSLKVNDCFEDLLQEIYNENQTWKINLGHAYFIQETYFKEAIKYDLRGFFQILLIYLLFKQNILHTFFFKSDLELLSLRICLFIFSFSCDFAFNALFYFNDKISDRYHYKGDNLYLYSFINNITITIFSTLGSFILKISLKYLTNSNVINKLIGTKLFNKTIHVPKR